MSWVEFLKNISPSPWECITLGCNAAAILLIYSNLRNKKSKLHVLNSAITVPNTVDLIELTESAPGGCLPYVVVDGTVEAVEQPLQSKYVPGLHGVVQSSTVKEHLVRWSPVSRLWYEDNRVIDRSMNQVPFYLLGKDGNKIFVSHLPKEADIKYNFSHSQFTDSQSSAITQIADWVSGMRSKGIENTEKLILTGSKVCSFGELVVGKGRELWLQAPKRPAPFILGSDVSQNKLIDSAATDVTVTKVFLFLFGVAGVGVLAYMAYGMMRKYKEWKIRERILTERERRKTEGRRKRGGGGDSSVRSPDDVLCVVCEERVREVLLKDCGHVCVCLECYEQLNKSVCPVCRATIIGYEHAFIP